MGWDLLEVKKQDKWIVKTDVASFHNQFENSPSGTIIEWRSLNEKLYSNEKDWFNSIQDVKSYLRMIYHRFLEGTVSGKNKLTIKVNGELLKPWSVAS